MTAEIIRAEKWREERILDAGYEIVRWGWGDANRPEVLAHRLRAAFARGVAADWGARQLISLLALLREYVRCARFRDQQRE